MSADTIAKLVLLGLIAMTVVANIAMEIHNEAREAREERERRGED